MNIVFTFGKIFIQKQINIYKKKNIRFFIRNLIRSNSNLYLSWFLLSLTEFNIGNYIISEKILYLAFYFSSKFNNYIIEFNLIKFHLWNSVLQLSSKKILVKILYKAAYLTKKKICFKILFFFPKNFFYWKLVSLYYKFDILVSFKNKNYCYTTKEIWMRMCLLNINFSSILPKIQRFINNVIQVRYDIFSYWFFFSIRKIKQINMKIELFSFVLNSSIFFLELRKYNQFFFYYKKKILKKFLASFAKPNFDIDFLISKIMLLNLKKKNLGNIFIYINSTFLGNFNHAYKFTAVKKNKFNFLESFLLKQFNFFYYPFHLKCINQYYPIKISLKKYQIYFSKLFSINSKVLSICNINKKTNFSYFYKSILNKSLLKGLYEKNKEFLEINFEKFMPIEGIKKKVDSLILLKFDKSKNVIRNYENCIDTNINSEFYLTVNKLKKDYKTEDNKSQIYKHIKAYKFLNFKIIFYIFLYQIVRKQNIKKKFFNNFLGLIFLINVKKKNIKFISFII
nr:hypothetical protein CcurKRNrm2_p020 [Cryptomonas curvata]